MATVLRKALSRETVESFENYGPNRGRPYIVTLEPGDLITFRAKKRREGVTARLSDVYRMILLARSNAERMAALRARKEAKQRKRAERALRRPLKG